MATVVGGTRSKGPRTAHGSRWSRPGSSMAEKLDPKDLVTLADLAISSMWEMAALVELERKGLLLKGT